MATDADIELSDMLESYPPATTPGFQTIITAKKEFSELASDPKDRLPPGKGFRPFKHQKLTHRYLRAYDDIMIISETGSGKSCEVLGFIEYTRKELEKAKINPSEADEKAAHFKRVIVLVRGKTQKNEFRNQLVCKCSDGNYLTSIVTKAKTETVQKTNLTHEIKKAGYAVYTYRTFAHRIAEQYPTEADNARLAEDYADTIFWIDEAHNLIIENETKNTYREKRQTYITLSRVLHNAIRSKRIISTATPMINEVNEIASLMNLILPIDGVLPFGYDYRNAPENDIRVLFPDIPFDHRTASPEEIAPYFRGQFPESYNFKTATLEDLEPFFRGRIGFIRASDTGAIPEEQGIHETGEYELEGVRYRSQLVIYATSMSEYQSDSYTVAKNSIDGGDELHGAVRQASNFVFPDGYWGNGTTDEEREAQRQKRRIKESNIAAMETSITNELSPTEIEELPLSGIIPISAMTETTEGDSVNRKLERRAFRRYVTVRGDTYSPTAEFIPWLQNLGYISMLSCKYAEIVKIVMSDPGNAFVYGEFVKGSGTIVLALCFEGMGFIRYNESTSMFVGVGGNVVKPVCAGSDRDVSNRRVRIQSHQQGAPFRYGLLTRDTSDSKFQSMMEAMNSYENRHGDYIKVLISSRVGRDAINVNNVLQIHLIGSEWNQSSIYQAMSRGIRATSHDDLRKEEEDRIRAEMGDITTARITVKVYKHAAVALDDSSIDLQMYRMAEYKDRSIKRVMRIMKQCAIACQIHYNRNVLPTDIDYTPTCDYDICRYNCVDPPPTEDDYSTYDVLYSDEIVSDALGEIINVYRQKNALTLDAIESLLPHYRRKYLIMALERLVTNKTRLIDRFGYTTYLREDRGSFYLDRSYPTGVPSSYSMSYYTQGIIGVEQDSLANIVVKLEAEENREFFSQLEHFNVQQSPEFNSRLAAVSIEGQASILEEVIIRDLRGNRSNFTDAIINRFQRMIFNINEPVTELSKIYEQLEQRRPRRGRKRNPDIKRRIKKINPITVDETKIVRDDNTERVYLHTLYSQVINQTGYATTARFNKGEGRTRLLKPSSIDNGWRDLNEIELPVYNAFIQIEIAKRTRPFEDQGIYGFVLPDGRFRIRDRLTESFGAAEDARKIKRGKVCETWYRPDLIDVMWEIGVPEPTGYFPEYKVGQEGQLIRDLIRTYRINKSTEELTTWTLQQLIYYAKWFSATKVKREVLCELIKERMAQTGRLIL